MQSRLIDWYLFRLLLDSLVFLYLVFYCAGFSLCGFSLCGFATSRFSMCGYCPCGRKEKGAICALSSVFLCRNIGDMAMPSKTAYSERKRPKSTFILTVNCPVHPPFKSKKCLSHRDWLARPWGQAVWIFWLLMHCWFCVILYSRLSFIFYSKERTKSIESSSKFWTIFLEPTLLQAGLSWHESDFLLVGEAPQSP